jgi:protein gp37
VSTGTKIEWTDATWNPVTGCTKVSAGCDHCYAERFAKRLQAMGVPAYRNGFAVTMHPEALDVPLHWRKPRMVFVCSMGDLFHSDVPEWYIRQVFRTMRIAERHTFQVLTKRVKRAAEILGSEWLPRNIWVGTSVENAPRLDRVFKLKQIPARIRFLSLEPLLGSLPNFDLFGIDWVIVGGESGPGARPMDPDWVRDIRDQCVKGGVPFFFKQWGGTNKKKSGRMLDGRTWDQMPERRGM